MNEVKKSVSFYKPTIDTLFHIDFDWWLEIDSNWRILLQDFLCPFHQEYFSSRQNISQIDVIDPETAEVTKEDGLLYELMHHCAKELNYISANIPLIAKIFRIFLSNGNHPLSPKDLEKLVNRPAKTILATLTGPQVYKGIRQIRD